MSESVSFQPFPKIPRLNREIIITEKIDGTNAAIVIAPLKNTDVFQQGGTVVGDYGVLAQSRTRFIYPGNDNYGFAKWVEDNAEALVEGLGEGTHFGEWYGQGIQRRYDLDEKRFMLFNVTRWAGQPLPERVEVATELYRGAFDSYTIECAVDDLNDRGSQHVKGFSKPEGIVVYHTAANQVFKVLCENDEIPKTFAEAPQSGPA